MTTDQPTPTGTFPSLPFRAAESREHLRYKLPPGYTLVRVKEDGASRYTRQGHAYDISASGMRFELDRPMKPGTRVQLRATLPGMQHITFEAMGHIVRIHDDADERGPVRMAVHFDEFVGEGDAERLNGYLADVSGGRLAA